MHSEAEASAKIYTVFADIASKTSFNFSELPTPSQKATPEDIDEPNPITASFPPNIPSRTPRKTYAHEAIGNPGSALGFTVEVQNGNFSKFPHIHILCAQRKRLTEVRSDHFSSELWQKGHDSILKSLSRAQTLRVTAKLLHFIENTATVLTYCKTTDKASYSSLTQRA